MRKEDVGVKEMTLETARKEVRRINTELTGNSFEKLIWGTQITSMKRIGDKYDHIQNLLLKCVFKENRLLSERNMYQSHINMLLLRKQLKNSTITIA